VETVPLTAIEARVLGSLIEKQITTPDYYPLSLNALTNACNQLTNRDPVMALDESAVARAVEGLREKRLGTVFHGAESRVARYKHTFTDAILLTPAEVALLCVLLLRGPQTVGELRTRAERLFAFESLAEVDEVLAALIARQPDPLVAKLPRQPGTKESRYAHLLSGPIEVTASITSLPPDSAPLAVRAENDRLANHEEEIASLRRELAELRQQFAEFRKQFE
jgi:uncharacterized protein YceH (UPF0502 family)